MQQQVNISVKKGSVTSDQRLAFQVSYTDLHKGVILLSFLQPDVLSYVFHIPIGQFSLAVKDGVKTVGDEIKVSSGENLLDHQIVSRIHLTVDVVGDVDELEKHPEVKLQ